jgi:predicted SnoaL-like aldol condensation-catalyzing enzyme
LSQGGLYHSIQHHRTLKFIFTFFMYMKSTHVIAVGLCALACQVTRAQTTNNHLMETPISNKEIVLDFWKRAIGQGNLEVAEQRIAEDYIQHSASGKPGKAALLETLATLKQMSKPENPPKPFMRVIADGDYVVLHMLIAFGGQTMIVLDMVRLKDARFAEHWDVVQPMTEPTAHAAIEGPTQINDPEQTTSNKQRVAEFVEAVLNEKHWERLADFVSPGIISHDPEARPGLLGWKEMLQRYRLEKMHRIIGEGNFVMTQSRLLQGEAPYACYDIYRLDKNMIVEHWRVKQPIPATLPHNNGMI